MSLNQKYEERVRKFSFFAQHRFKAELYRYITSLSLVNICQNYIGLYQYVSRSSILLARRTSNIKS